MQCVRTEWTEYMRPVCQKWKLHLQDTEYNLKFLLQKGFFFPSSLGHRRRQTALQQSRHAPVIADERHHHLQRLDEGLGPKGTECSCAGAVDTFGAPWRDHFHPSKPQKNLLTPGRSHPLIQKPVNKKRSPPPGGAGSPLPYP